MRNIFLKGITLRPGGSCDGFFAALCLSFALQPLFFCLLSAARIHPDAGSASAAFLKIGQGARATALAGAYTAISDDAYALYWNPAGLSDAAGRNLAFTHNDYFAGLSQEFAAYTAPASSFGLFRPGAFKGAGAGISLNYLYTGKVLERRSGSYEAGNDASPVEGKFGAADLAITAGAGFPCGTGLRCGASLKAISQVIDDRSGASAALDLGAIYSFNWLGRRLTAGAAVRNIGPGIKFSSRRYGLPFTAAAGLSGRPWREGPLLSLDVSKPSDNYASIALGAEYPLGGRLLLRGGYRYRHYGNESGGASGLALGLGFLSGRFSFDYALAPFGDLGNTHRLSAAMRFLEPAVSKKRAAVIALPSVDAVKGGELLALRFEQKPQAITRKGMSLLVRGTAASAADDVPGLMSVSFMVLTRGQAVADAEVSAGQLPEKLLAKFPFLAGPDAVWQLLSVPRGIDGELRLEFKSAARSAGEPGFYYLSAGDWKEAVVEAGACGEKVCAYSVSVPLSTHYAFGHKSR
ncbi:MAG: hypothetical protein A2234_07845 [Elusimicrobia bacterium RIFOXYA2_FULL_58_8]|nr:MAG: hypothetical protein A2285_01715 [Elusimicrobia bacterium RIFOXYA12_FULL_57_11]OGS12674.1 MAG: hypothetical protein A2234_07845 [Elusimicrobia bacterium RIFOXYA2_FULL_58_8]